MKEIVNIEAKEEHLLFIGDMHYHISSKYVENNHGKLFAGGKHLIDLLDNEEYFLVNSLDMVDHFKGKTIMIQRMMTRSLS